MMSNVEKIKEQRVHASKGARNRPVHSESERAQDGLFV